MTGFTGSARLLRLALRRDRLTLPAWVLGMGAFVAVTTALFDDRFATNPVLLEQDTRIVVENPGMRVLGLVTGASVGGYTLHRDALTLAVLAAMMSVLAVVRHTRQSEELGREEMLGAVVVGRYASLAAATAVTLAANVALALTIALGLVVAGQPVAGSLVGGASIGVVGVFFTRSGCSDVAAVVDQPRGDRPRERRTGRSVRARGPRQHDGDGGRGGSAGDQRLAGVAVAHRLGPADATVRRQPLVASVRGRPGPGRALRDGGRPRRPA